VVSIVNDFFVKVESFGAFKVPGLRSLDQAVEVPPGFLEIFSTVLVLIPSDIFDHVAFDKIKGV